jgi:aminocarboxymuconate-semialdehyde decarboxylase
MHIIDSHFHWWPRPFFEDLCRRSDYPRAVVNDSGGYTYMQRAEGGGSVRSWAAWYDLEEQFAHMDGLGHRVDVVASIGPFSVYFSELEPSEGRDEAMKWNEHMAAAQRRYPGRFWASAAIPLADTGVALEVLEHAVGTLGLMGVNLPGSIGRDPYIDAPRLEPFYARLAELGIPAFLHPTDAIFPDMLQGYGGALHLSLGRVMERNPGLKLVLSHTGGALPYQSGRMDKNTKNAKLKRPVSTYLKQMYTDTVSPHSAGMRFAIEYYGIDNVMYGTDYPCWDPATCLALLDEIALSAVDREKLLRANAIRNLGLKGALDAAAA